MKKFWTKSKIFYCQTVFGFFLSVLIFLYVSHGNGSIDRMVASNAVSTVCLFIITLITLFIITFKLDIIKEKMFAEPHNIYEMLTLLNYQVLLFSVLYFFLDALFNNASLPILFSDIQFSWWGKGAAIILVAVYFLKKSGFSVGKRQFCMKAAVTSIIIVQLNFIEVCFLLGFLAIYSIMKKNRIWIAKALCRVHMRGVGITLAAIIVIHYCITHNIGASAIVAIASMICVKIGTVGKNNFKAAIIG